MTIMAQSFDIGCNQCGDWKTVPASTAAEARRKLRGNHRWTSMREEGRINDLCAACATTYRNEQLIIKADRQRARVATIKAATERGAQP